MNWKQLAEKIAEMKPHEQRQRVRLLAPYGEDGPIELDGLWEADASAEEHRKGAKKGQHYLRH